MAETPFNFLIVSERSGSNLFLRIMHANSECLGAAPTHLHRIMHNNRSRYGDLADDAEWRRMVADCAELMRTTFIHWESGVDEEDLLRRCRERNPAEVIRRIYEAEMERYGKSSVLIKENWCYRLVPFLMANYPDCRFVFMVRDPRDMALSWKRITWWMAGKEDRGIRGGAKLWMENQRDSLEVYSALRDTGRIVLLRYEDLLRRPETELRRVCDTLGLAYEPAMLDFHKSDKARGDAEASQAFRNLSSPLNPENYGKFATQLDEAEVRWIEHVCAREMEMLGYSPVHSTSDDFEELDRLVDEVERREAAESEEKARDPEEDARRQRRFETLKSIFTRPEIPLYPPD
ncbi:sulfotransferase family protein [Desulfohalovibrio reitneri]|uniref:sulfotransferase family protein n=1 Tax=Desulfohalovibrio reitneri TaxID=1307759 RepID=UPI0004A6BA52|nr:sulfotransferase [Desulfohalovibrio reitneri]